MNNYLARFKEWFEARNLREKLLVTGLSWALIYALSALLFFLPLDNKIASKEIAIKKSNEDIAILEEQLKYLRNIPSTAIYKDWLANRNSYEALKKKYKDLLGKPDTEKWDDIIKAVLSHYPNIAIDTIHNFPEVLFDENSPDTKADDIYKRRAQVTVLGTYQDVYGYLQYLEKSVPNIHWDLLTYKVTEYPEAKVDMEFSVLYEKTQN